MCSYYLLKLKKEDGEGLGIKMSDRFRKREIKKVKGITLNKFEYVRNSIILSKFSQIIIVYINGGITKKSIPRASDSLKICICFTL